MSENQWRARQETNTNEGASLEELRHRVRELESDLRESRQLALLGSNMKGLAHSIRSALGLCRAATHMVDRALGSGDREKLERAWQMVKRSSSRTAELTASLLDPEGVGRLKPTLGDPDALVREICEYATEQARDQGDELECQLAGDLDGVTYDRQALHRICVELLSNALDALAELNEPGRVVITTEGLDDGWLLSVIDTGPGMSSERLRRVMGGGYSSKGKGGSGLGLLQVRQLVKSHGGTVEITTEVGKGTEVHCRFPSAPPVSSSEEEERDAC